MGTDSPNAVTVPPAGITIPAGQTSATFSLPTLGVAQNVTANITATLLKFTLQQTGNVDVASLSTLSFNPQHVPGGSSSTGTVSLNGLAGSSITVSVDGDKDAGFTGVPVTLTIPAQSQTATFTIGTPIAPAVAQLNCTATMLAQGNYAAGTATATLFIDSYNLTNFSIDNSEIPSGGVANGTVTIAQPAPAGGVIVNIATSNALIASVPSSVTIAQGQTSGTFQINGGFMAVNQTALISVSRNGQTLPSSSSPNLTVDALGVTLQLNPNDVLGGSSSQGSITISAPAPLPNGITFTVGASPSGLVSLSPTTVTIPAGSLTNDPYSFLVSTLPVTSSASVDISTTWTDALGVTAPTVDQFLTIEPVAIQSISFSSDIVKQRVGVTQCTLTLSGPAPAGGALVTISQNPVLLVASSTQLIQAGQTSLTFPMRAKAVTRNLQDIVTATYNNSVSAVVTIVR